MKKITIIVSIIFICFTAIPLFAVDLNLGAATWYSWWEMETDRGTQTIDPTFLVGPVVSLGFSEKWNLSMVFLYGQFEMEEENNTNEINRVDSDISLNYVINNYLKVFGGLKAMGYYFDNGRHQSIGPALGVGLTIPIVGNYYFLGNISGMYNYGEHQDEDNESGNERRSIIREYGFNSTVSLAYYIESASTTVSIGGRYQYFRDDYELEQSEDTDLRFYGITLSVVYSF